MESRVARLVQDGDALAADGQHGQREEGRPGSQREQQPPRHALPFFLQLPSSCRRMLLRPGQPALPPGAGALLAAAAISFGGLRGPCGRLSARAQLDAQPAHRERQARLVGVPGARDALDQLRRRARAPQADLRHPYVLHRALHVPRSRRFQQPCQNGHERLLPA
jgi:hypothetical protein